MTGLPWVKVWVEMLDDVKVGRLTESQRWRFIQLILLAAECDAAGALVTGDSPMTHGDVTWRLRCDIKDLEKDIKDMCSAGLIHLENGVIVVTRFAERQGPTQAEKRSQWRARQKARRERVKLENVTQESPVTHADVTHIEEEREEEREEEEEKISTTAANIFQLYEQNIGLLSPIISDALIDAEKIYPLNWIEAAMKEAVTNNKRSWSYAEAILKRWKVDGFGVDTRSKRNGKASKDRPGDKDPKSYVEGEFGKYIEH